MTLPEQADLTAEQQRLLLQKLLQQRASEDSQFPMSVQQQGLWFDHCRNPSHTAFNVFLPTRVRSTLNSDALQQSVNLLVERHPCLRTTFSDTEREPVQKVHRDLRPDFQIIDASGQSEDQIRQLAAAEVSRPFDLENGPLLRMLLYKRRADDWIVIAMTHHIVVDFWSLVLLLSEMRELYQALVSGRDARLPPADGNYAAYVRRQRALLTSDRGHSLRQYWRQQIEDASLVAELPTDFVRPRHFTGRADVVRLKLSREIVTQLAEVSSACGVTVQASVLALLHVLIHRYTGQTSFLIGSPFAGRLQQEYEQTVGFFANMLPLRADLRGEPTFVELVQRVAGTLVGALEHEDFPLAEIVRDSDGARDPSRTPLFQIACTFEKSHLRNEQGRAGFLLSSETIRTEFAGLEQQSFMIPPQSCHHDMEWIFELGDDGLHGMICYCKDLFRPDTMQQIASHFEQLAEQLLHHRQRPVVDVPWPSSATGSSRVAIRATESQADREASLITHLVQRMAIEVPTQTALSSADGNVSYQSLQSQSLAIAQSLADRGTGPGDYVPVIGRRGPQVIPALLGVLQAGAAVVPIDSDQPAIAIGDLVDDTAASVIVVDDPAISRQFADELHSKNVRSFTVNELIEESLDRPASIPPARLDDLCYLIYTSGSSGRPKGVMIEHGAINNTLQWRIDTVPLSKDDRILILLSHQFDAGFGLLMTALTQGSRLYWLDQPAPDADAIIDLILRESITVLPAIPSLLSLIIDHPRFGQCTSLRQVWTGGETMPTDLPSRLRDQHGEIPFWNFYGPTEAAIEATALNMMDHDSRCIVPIGRPLRNTEILVLDSQQRPVPPTLPGELAIHGPGLARGYLNQPRQTAEKFPTLPDGRRVYLTGDRGRQRADGVYEFLGRFDDQVKVGGYRIELEEVEGVLESSPDIAEAAVAVHRPTSGAPECLIAFLEVASGSAEQHASSTNDERLSRIHRFVASQLPTYKRPRRVQVVDALPKTSSGKVDRKRLPRLSDSSFDNADFVAPRTALERFLAETWSDILELSNVGIHHDFFHLGGTSLQAAMMTVKLSEQLQVHVPTSLVFDLADIAAMSERLVQLHGDKLAERFGSETVAFYKNAAREGDHGGKTVDHPLIAEFRENDFVLSSRPRTCSAERTPIFMIHPPGGIVLCYRELAQRLSGTQRPFFAIRSRGLHGEEQLPQSVAEMAADYVDAIKSVYPAGPYQVGGWSLGGIIAYEVTRQLVDAGERVERLILLDTAIPPGATDLVSEEELSDAGHEYGLDTTLEELAQLNPEEQLPLLWNHAKNLGVLDDTTPQAIVDQVLEDLQHLFHRHVDLATKYRIEPLPVPVLLVRPRDVPVDVVTTDDRGWAAIIDDLTVEFVGGHHHSMVQSPHVDEIASLLHPAP